MKIQFKKYHGTGNDFILVDNRSLNWRPSKDQISSICSRRFGIGSDGLILLENHDEYDYNMNFYNPDGSQSFCGNGSRCAFRFAQDIGVVGEDAVFEAIDGRHEAKVEDGMVAILMGDVGKILRRGNDLILNTGSPHFIRFRTDVETMDVNAEGSAIRNEDEFQDEGINVNFVKGDEGGVFMRTYERGVEHETFSCGTGVTAAALAWSYEGNSENQVKVKTRGGNLKVTFDKSPSGYQNIWLIGPAQEVYEGEIVVR